MVNALAGLADGARLSQGFQDTYDNSRLNMLAGKAYTAPQEQRQSLLGQMAAVNPQAAQAQQQKWQGDEDRQTKLLVNGARYMKGALDSKNPNAVAGAWKSVRPALIRAGMATEQELSPEWDPSYEQTVHQLLAMGGPDTAGGVLQSQKIGADGFIYNSFRDGRMVNTGVKADRQAWFRDQEGFAPEIVNKDGTTTALGGPPPAAGGGTTFTSSTGEPFDVSQVADPNLRQQILSNPESYGFAPDGARANLPATNVTPAQYASRTRPTAAQNAADVERAKLQAQQDFLPTELGMRTNAAIAQTQGQEQVKQGVERAGVQATKTRDANDAIRLITEARRLLPSATGGRLAATGDSVAGFFGSATEGAKANAALKTIAGQMTAKMPRMEGPQSDRDVQMYKEMAGDVANENLPVEIRQAALNQIERLQSKYATNAPIRIQSAEDYNQLPPGALYTAPDGSQRRKR